jgi:hypothetical protein
LCTEAVFGRDIDFLTWDYGMTDGHADIKILTYFYRGAGLNPGRPAILGKGIAQANRAGRTAQMETLGLAAFGVNDGEMGLVNGAIPDTSIMTEKQISEMPELVRNFKCVTSLENGEPHCKAEKYNEYVCPNRKGKVSWHPGV